MNQKRILSLLLVIMILMMSLAGCAAPAKETSEPETPAAESVEAEAPEEEPAEEVETEEPTDTAITVTDQGGNTVTLDKPAERVVTTFFGQTYAMIALGLKDRLVAMDSKGETRPLYNLAAPEILELPTVGTLKEFNVEAAIAMDPDVMLLPKRLQEHAAAFAAVDIPVAICDPESQDLLEEMLTMIATLCGVPENAEKLIAYYDEKFSEMSEITANLSDKPSVYIAGNSEYLSVAPDSMYQASLINLAGGVNAASGIEGDYWAEVSYEQLLNLDPDVIVLPSEVKYSKDDILNDPQLSDLKAVQNDTIYAMPSAFDAWDAPGPSGIMGSLWLLSKLQPDSYSIDQMRDDAAEFYKEFYGFDIDPQAIQ